MSKLIGTIGKIIYQSANNYLVFLFKVKENDLDKKYNNHSITATGYLYDIQEGIDLEIIGELTKHNKYGEQFQITSYQKIIPSDKNSIVKFFSSELFKGIGENKALKIYEILGDEAIKLIKADFNILDKISILTNKNKEVIINKLTELNNSSETIINLTNLGFTVKDATSLYKYYKEEILNIINTNIYQIYYDLETFSFNKIDAIALKNGIEKNAKIRVKAGIINTMIILSQEKGDTYSYNLEIYDLLKIIINYLVSEEFFLECLNELLQETKIINIKDQYQLINYYQADLNIVKRLTYLNNKPDNFYKTNVLNQKISKYEKEFNIIYDNSQKEAISKSFLKDFLIITGGPGTGKTTIVKTIVNIYLDLFKTSYEEIALLAPTGRASKRIMEATNFKASTIHRFLKWNKDTNRFQVNQRNKSDVKLVIIDESSMLDTLLFSALLDGLKYDTKLILVGDKAQLPSVAPGEVLKDLITSSIFPVISLNQLYRQQEGSKIINLAYNITNNKSDYSIFNQSNDLLFYQADSNTLQDSLVTIIKKLSTIDYHNVQIMAPMYKTLNGINNLNKLMQELLNKKTNQKNEILIYDTIFREGDKVLQLVNMPDDNIYNGDIGIIIEINNMAKEITIDFDSNLVTFNSSNFNNFTLGYVISIHKSQGSEFKTVIIPILKEYSRMLSKKLIYTAITRSRENLILLGEVEAYEKALKTDLINYRKTNLKEKIENRYQ